MGLSLLILYHEQYSIMKKMKRLANISYNGINLPTSKWDLYIYLVNDFFDYVRQIIYHVFFICTYSLFICNINIYPSRNPKNMNYFKKICILV